MMDEGVNWDLGFHENVIVHGQDGLTSVALPCFKSVKHCRSHELYLLRLDKVSVTFANKDVSIESG